MGNKKKCSRIQGFEGSRAEPITEKDTLTYRSLPIKIREDGKPSTLNEETRSVEVTGATETPCDVWDWERWEIVSEVLRMDGCEMPSNKQVVLLDSHYRGGTASVIGSFRDMKVTGDLSGRAHFTSLPEGDGPYIKLREGHLTDFSIGYRVLESEYVKSGETKTINGKTYKGPVKVSTRWQPKELSICPIGADVLAKARSEQINNIKQEDTKMNERLRAILIARGMSPNATEDEAWAYLEANFGTREVTVEGDKIKPVSTPENGDLTRKAIEEERQRVSEISAMCRKFDVTEAVREKLIADGAAIDQARKEVLEIVAQARKTQPAAPEPGFMGPVTIVAEERDKFRAAAQDGMLLRAGMTVEKPAAGALDLRQYSLKELARMSLRMANITIPQSTMEMVGRAMVTGDFSNLLANVANKSLFTGWETAEETWRTWCGIGSVPDFKTNYAPRASETDDLDEVPEHGEYKYGELSEASESYSIVTYGKLFAITRQTIINDDLNALTNIPMKHGEAAARKVGDLPYAVLTANANMGDAIALFHASHGNLGTGGVLSETTAGEAVKLMRLQKDIRLKRRLNIRAQYFVAPATIEGHAETFFQTFQYASDNKAATRNNIYSGNRFERVYDARLDDSSTTAYYFMGPKGKTVVVYFLEGNEQPYMETKTGWSVDGVEYKVRIDAGAKAMDWRGLVKNAGA